MTLFSYYLIRNGHKRGEIVNKRVIHLEHFDDSCDSFRFRKEDESSHERFIRPVIMVNFNIQIAMKYALLGLVLLAVNLRRDTTRNDSPIIGERKNHTKMVPSKFSYSKHFLAKSHFVNVSVPS